MAHIQAANLQNVQKMVFFGEKFQESMGKGILVANLATGFQNWVIDTRKLGALAYLCCAIFCAIF